MNTVNLKLIPVAGRTRLDPVLDALVQAAQPVAQMAAAGFPATAFCLQGPDGKYVRHPHLTWVDGPSFNELRDHITAALPPARTAPMLEADSHGAGRMVQDGVTIMRFARHMSVQCAAVIVVALLREGVPVKQLPGRIGAAAIPAGPLTGADAVAVQLLLDSADAQDGDSVDWISEHVAIAADQLGGADLLDISELAARDPGTTVARPGPTPGGCRKT
jgi:hypothetical protein